MDVCVRRRRRRGREGEKEGERGGRQGEGVCVVYLSFYRGCIA